MLVPCKLTNNEIRAITLDVIRYFDYQPKDSLHILVERLGGEVSYSSNTLNSFTLMTPHHFIITMPYHFGPRREKFAIAYELGHWFLHYIGLGLDEKGVTVETKEVCNLADTEANWFASHLTMPEPQFYSAWVKRKGRSDLLTQDFQLPEIIIKAKAKAFNSFFDLDPQD